MLFFEYMYIDRGAGKNYTHPVCINFGLFGLLWGFVYVMLWVQALGAALKFSLRGILCAGDDIWVTSWKKIQKNCPFIELNITII